MCSIDNYCGTKFSDSTIILHLVSTSKFNNFMADAHKIIGDIADTSYVHVYLMILCSLYW